MALTIKDQMYAGIINLCNLNRGTKYTMEGPLIKLEKIRIRAMVVIIRPCSPFPEAPRYCEIVIAINKLMIAVSSFAPKVLKILFIKLAKVMMVNIQKLFTNNFCFEFFRKFNE